MILIQPISANSNGAQKGGLVTIGILFNGHLAFMPFHVKVADIAIEHGIGNRKAQIVAVVWQDEIVHPQTTVRSAQVSPLLMLGQE